MNHVLLLISPGLEFQRASRRALELAREQKAGLVVAALIPDSQLASLASTLSDVAFVGEKLSADVTQHLREELEALAKEQLETIEQQATAAGLPVATHVLNAEPFEAAEQMMARYPVRHVVVAVPARPWLDKLWGREGKPAWMDEVGCPVETVEEERS